MSSLHEFGWTNAIQAQWEVLNLEDLQPARVIADFGTSLKIAATRVQSAELSGKLAHYSNPEDVPKVGDWVAVRISGNDNATIESVVLRANDIARKVAGKQTKKQIIAANVDIAFVLLSLDSDFSVERLKRFLYQLSVSAIEPVIVLNKADKTNDIEDYISQLRELNIPIITMIATEDVGVHDVTARIKPGRTAILLGSSGVGKSTLTNKLLGRVAQKTAEIRPSDDTGKHTTVHRELFILPSGGILIDTPGIRELQLWGTEEELDANYDDVTELAAQCRYSNCRHDKEQGCAVNEALESGKLDRKHYSNYLKMKRELELLATRNTKAIRELNKRITRDNKAKQRDDNYENYN